MRTLVTGGGTGLGLGIARALVATGDGVVLCGRRAEPLQAAAEALKAELPAADVQWFQRDVRDEPERLLDAAGPVDGLVHSAGIYRHAALGDWTAADWADLFGVHVQGPALLSQAFAARLAGPGALVFVCSTLAERTAPGAAAYAAAKAAQASLCRSLALELAPRGVRANAILAGVVPTAMTTAPRDGAEVAAQLEGLRALHPLGRLGAPADIGAAVAFLLHASWITGAALPVDGGLLVG